MDRKIFIPNKMQNQMSKCCCVLILYNPASLIEAKIKQYSRIFPFLCVVDNTPKSIIKNSFESDFTGKAVYFIHNANRGGIARALNIGVKEAISRKFEWIMTLDQDSNLNNETLKNMWEAWRNNKQHNIAIIAPYLWLQTNDLPVNLPDYEFPFSVMTSGSILRIDAYKKVGLFDEKLVIDYVDHDYCLRLHLKGYKIMRANKAIMEHILGRAISHNLFGRNVLSTNHSALRRYYIARNRLYTAFKYRGCFPHYFWRELRLTFYDFIIILLFEEKKLSKIKMMLRGIKDFCVGKRGEL